MTNNQRKPKPEKLKQESKLQNTVELCLAWASESPLMLDAKRNMRRRSGGIGNEANLLDVRRALKPRDSPGMCGMFARSTRNQHKLGPGTILMDAVADMPGIERESCR